MSDIFDGVEGVEPGTKDPYVVQGRYTVAVEDVKFIEQSKKDKVPTYVARWRVIRSNNPLRPPGSTMSWIIKLKNDNAIDLKRKDIALHAAAAYRCPHTKVTGDVVRGTYHEDQPLRGRLLDVEAFDIGTNAGGKYTKCQFSEPKSSDQELMAELERVLRDPAAAPPPSSEPAQSSAPATPPGAPPVAPPPSTRRGPTIPV